MFFTIDPSNGLAIYEQVVRQLIFAIAAGVVRAGDMVPSVRELARELAINPNTVARAYQNLERDGVLATVPGGRTYVAENPTGLLKSEKIRRLRPHARQIAVEGTQLRLDPQEIIDLVQQELNSLEEAHERHSDLDRKAR